MQAVYKKDNKRYEIYDISYKKPSGFPCFLIYKDGQWLTLKAKYFIPVADNNLNLSDKTNIIIDNKRKKVSKTCVNCKYRHVDKIYDSYDNEICTIYGWCDKDRDLMDTTVGNNKHYMYECEEFEENDEK